MTEDGKDPNFTEEAKEKRRKLAEKLNPVTGILMNRRERKLRDKAKRTR